MVYRPEFIEFADSARASGIERHREIVQEKAVLAGVIDAECPEFTQFLHDVELCGDLAAGSANLSSLISGHCAEQNSYHVTTGKVLDRLGATVWQFRTRAFGVVGLASAGATSGESWNVVALRFSVDQQARRVDSEFFAWNEEVDGSRSAMDDVEKFHIVWEYDANDQKTLVYAGFGANQPFHLAHPHSARFLTRPRYWVFDRDRRETYKYRPTWRNLGPFDWNWMHTPARRTSQGVALRFVQLLDGSYICLSDEEVVKAGSGDDWASWKDAYEKAGALAAFQSWDATVDVPAVQTLSASDAAPELLDFVSDPARDCLAYFASLNASNVAITSAADIRKVARVLGPTRSAQYEAKLERPCRDVFESRFAAQLPGSMAELFHVNTTNMDPQLADAVRAWTAKQTDEVRCDLYHYGQETMTRMNRLRFAAWLALQDRFGGVYARALDIAFGALKGEDRYGVIEATL